ncbi:hypothetical protein A2U01_0114776, partial [Trifolium medium]|nr:hypothetical protein [Trifolium medium]
GGIELKPPQSTLLCIMSPGEVSSPEVANYWQTFCCSVARRG